MESEEVPKLTIPSTTGDAVPQKKSKRRRKEGDWKKFRILLREQNENKCVDEKRGRTRQQQQ